MIPSYKLYLRAVDTDRSFLHFLYLYSTLYFFAVLQSTTRDIVTAQIQVPLFCMQYSAIIFIIIRLASRKRTVFSWSFSCFRFFQFYFLVFFVVNVYFRVLVNVGVFIFLFVISHIYVITRLSDILKSQSYQHQYVYYRYFYIVILNFNNRKGGFNSETMKKN